jgi:hypothetical protein
MSDHEHSDEAQAMTALGKDIAELVAEVSIKVGVTPTGAASVLLYSAATVLLRGGLGPLAATDKMIELCKDMQKFLMERHEAGHQS